MNFSDVPISGDFWCICFALVVGVQSPGPSVSGVRRVGHRPTIPGGHLCLGRLRLQDRGLKAPLGRCKGEGQEDRTGGKDGRIGWSSCPFFVKGGHLGYGFNMLKSLR